ncbi:methyltransferase domain-containing protein (plasmid) [Streptomyces sp. BI20]|uniref:methyltransferase domain-containing protein n=1 Tax=Streptomyces sp. BI20 TaxID=3403460 RepID=UPI003C70D7F4
MTQKHDVEQAAARGLLGQVAEDLGAPVAPPWEVAYWAAPRSAFLPKRIWVGDELEEVFRDDQPERWLQLAYDNAPVITQVNDGREVDEGEERWPSCSASAPSIVFRMLDLLDVDPEHTVLEIGTGTGWNAALLSRRVGSERVTTIEVDPALSAAASIRLKQVGAAPRIVCGDGADGFAAGAPYDRVVATCSVRSVPSAWLEQTRSGGVILTPWDSSWFTFGLLRLVVDGHGAASGMFLPHSAFMGRREERSSLRIFRDVVRDDHEPVESKTDVSPWDVAGDGEWHARFALGLLLPDLWCTWHEDPDVDGVETRLWVASTDTGSWAAVDHDGKTDDEFTVWQYGTDGRRVWDEVEAAYAWWHQQGRPGPDRFGMTLTPDGKRTVWLDTPDNPVPTRT